MRHMPYFKDKNTNPNFLSKDEQDSLDNFDRFINKFFSKYFPIFFKVLLALVGAMILGLIIGIIIVVSTYAF